MFSGGLTGGSLIVLGALRVKRVTPEGVKSCCESAEMIKTNTKSSQAKKTINY